MSVGDLRKEFVKLQKEFVGGRVTAMKKHEVQHRLDVLKKAMTFKEADATPAPARTGPPSAREIPTKEVTIDGETTITKPLKPTEGPEPVVRKPRGPKKIKPMEVPAAPVPAPASAPAAEPKAPKKRLVPPKVIFDEVSVPKVKKERKIKPRPSTPTADAEAAPAPVAEAPAVKLPGCVRKISED